MASMTAATGDSAVTAGGETGMYEAFFGLSSNPFRMTPDPDQIFLTRAHSEALSGIVYGIVNRKGLVVLSGETGTGKTSILRAAMKYIPANRVEFALIVNPSLDADDFLELALFDFGVTDIPASKAQRLIRLQEFLLETHRQGRSCVLMVDEAQGLSPQLLEEIRLLTNFETAHDKLLQIVLAGQTELDALIERYELRQLKQRIAVRLALRPLSEEELAQYIRFRWGKASGGQEPPFTAEAIRAVFEYSGGIPRIVNSICDNALLISFASELRVVDLAQILEVCQDLNLISSRRRPQVINGAGGTRSPLSAVPPRAAPARMGREPVSGSPLPGAASAALDIPAPARSPKNLNPLADLSRPVAPSLDRPGLIVRMARSLHLPFAGGPKRRERNYE